MRLTFGTSLALVALDQALKWGVVVGLNLREVGRIDVLAPYLQLTMAWNRGVNFGLFADDSPLLRWALVLLALGISGWVWHWLRGQTPTRLMQVAAGLLIGGALGNAIDRAVWGAVADFLNVSCCGWVNPWAFNVADIAIFVGAFGLILVTPGKSPRDDGRHLG